MRASSSAPAGRVRARGGEISNVFASLREADGLVEGIVIDITDRTGAEAVDQQAR